MAVVAERAFTSRSTLQKVEAGDANVSIGIYAAGYTSGTFVGEVSTGPRDAFVRRIDRFPSSLRFVPVKPCRVVDTRNALKNLQIPVDYRDAEEFRKFIAADTRMLDAAWIRSSIARAIGSASGERRVLLIRPASLARRRWLADPSVGTARRQPLPP
mgnify:CR=1 FL=1